MSSIDIQLDGDRCWRDLENRTQADGSLAIFDSAGRPVLHTAELVGVALFPDGEVVDGVTFRVKRLPTVTLRIQLPDGHTAFVQLKLEMLEMLTRALRGRIEYLTEQRALGKADA